MRWASERCKPQFTALRLNPSSCDVAPLNAMPRFTPPTSEQSKAPFRLVSPSVAPHNNASLHHRSGFTIKTLLTTSSPTW